MSDPSPSDPPERFNFAAHLLQLNAERPNKTAYIDDEGPLSYGELDQRVRQVAQSLLDAGLRREERVLLLMHDHKDWPTAFLGALYAGLVPVAVNTLLTPEDWAFMLAHSRCQGALVSASLLPGLQLAMRQPHELRRLWLSDAAHAGEAVHAALAAGQLEGVALQTLAQVYQTGAPLAAAADTHRDDPGFWLYSSGSTGRPKGVLHTHANPYWTATLYGTPVLGLTESDVCFSAAKLFFAYGLGNGLSFPLSVGATTVLMAERPTPQAVFQRWVGANGAPRPTVFFGAPTGYAGMLAAPDLPAPSAVALRLCSSAGEALPADLGQRFERHFGCPVIDGLGSTEMLHIFLSNRPGAVHYGTSGQAVPGYRVSLRDEQGQEVADGEIGDLFISGPSAALLYWRNREKSNDTFLGEWTKSGDKYSRNPNGTYTYAGRSDDMLKVSGIYVSPFEIEATLIQHPAVLEAAVIGVLDAEGLTKSKAFVVLKAGQSVDEDGLKAFVKARLAPFKYPRQIAFLDELPKTATGKIQRFKLRALEGA